MFKKWWITLVQGILMFILGIFIMENPVEALAGASIWFGILLLITGLIGIIGWLFGGKENREWASLGWSVLCSLFGSIVLTNLLATMKAVTVIYGLWVLITGISLVNYGWPIKKETIIGWILLAVGIYSIVAGIMMIFNISTGATGFATLLGIQVVLSGLVLILFAFAKKWIIHRIRARVHSITEKRSVPTNN